MTIDIQWDKKFDMGHPRIDREHQAFLGLIRNVAHAADEQEPKEWCIRLLREVKKFAEFHFYSEDNVMLKIGYPEYAVHQQQHANLLTMLDERITAYINDRIDLEAVVVFMFDWYALHTSQADKKLGKYISLANQ